MGSGLIAGSAVMTGRVSTMIADSIADTDLITIAESTVGADLITIADLIAGGSSVEVIEAREAANRMEAIADGGGNRKRIAAGN